MRISENCSFPNQVFNVWHINLVAIPITWNITCSKIICKYDYNVWLIVIMLALRVLRNYLLKYRNKKEDGFEDTKAAHKVFNIDIGFCTYYWS